MTTGSQGNTTSTLSLGVKTDEALRGLEGVVKGLEALKTAMSLLSSGDTGAAQLQKTIEAQKTQINELTQLIDYT